MRHDIHPLLWAVFALFLLTQVLPAVITLFRLLRTDFSRVTVERLPAATPLPPLHQAALGELTALGFELFALYNTVDGYDKVQTAFLSHPERPVFANIQFRPGGFMAYPTWFWSFAADGRILMTGNRQPATVSMPGVDAADFYVQNLPAHLEAHIARLAGVPLANIDAEAALARVISETTDYMDFNLAQKTFVAEKAGTFLSFAAAWRMTWEVMRRRRVLRLPYATVVVTDPWRSAYFAELYHALDVARKRAKARLSISALLLLLSLGLSLALFSWWLGWKSALALMIVLTVHESGHALAMQLFGYRDMNMFFIPFMGAAVTGSAKNVPVWKQAIVLLAGPVPGLAFGIWTLLHPFSFPPSGFIGLLGIYAAVVNIFNLLPLSFLDGGKLVEIALLARWPYGLFAFALLSSLGLAAVIVYTNSYNMIFLALMFVMVARLLWRMARVRGALKAGGPQDLPGLFALTETTIKSKVFYRQYTVVRSIHEPPAVRPARGWETAFTLLLFIGCWALAGLAWLGWKQDRADDARFDDTVRAYYKNYKDGPGAVTEAAKTLSPDDPRQIDALVYPADLLSGPARLAAMEDILKLNRDGRNYPRRAIVAMTLDYAFWHSQGEPVASRIAELEKTLADFDAIAPDRFSDTVTTRLRLAELRDQGGDSTGAEKELDHLLDKSAVKDCCQSAEAQVAAAKAWFYIDKGQTGKALEFLSRAPYAAMTQKANEVAIAKAWALLQGGQNDAGLEQMKIAAPPVQPGAEDDGDLYNLEMIYAEWKAGHAAEAAALIPVEHAAFYCEAGNIEDYASGELWRRRYVEGIFAALKDSCGARWKPLEENAAP